MTHPRSWEIGAKGETNKQTKNYHLVYYKRLSAYGFGPKRIKLLYVCSEMASVVQSKSWPPVLTNIEWQSCHKDFKLKSKETLLSFKKLQSQPLLP